MQGKALIWKITPPSKLLGKGQVEVVFTWGNVLILRDVYYAPDISRNLVYVPTLNRLVYKLIFEYDRCIISKNLVYVGRYYLVMNLFKLCIR